MEGGQGQGMQLLLGWESELLAYSMEWMKLESARRGGENSKATRQLGAFVDRVCRLGMFGEDRKEERERRLAKRLGNKSSRKLGRGVHVFGMGEGDGISQFLKALGASIEDEEEEGLFSSDDDVVGMSGLDGAFKKDSGCGGGDGTGMGNKPCCGACDLVSE